MGSASEAAAAERRAAPRPRRRRVERFSRTERTLHWTHAASFFVMLATGLAIYLPGIAAAVGRRELLKDVHLLTAIAWAAALIAIVVLGDRRRLAADWREVQTIDRDDRRWLRSGGRAPQGRFNAGQKVNTIATVAFALLFTISGIVLWLGERDHRYMLAGAGTLHDVLTWASVALVSGHLYLALIHPTTRHALAGMTTGTVRDDWARRHHAKWMREHDAGQAAPATEESAP